MRHVKVMSLVIMNIEQKESVLIPETIKLFFGMTNSKHVNLKAVRVTISDKILNFIKMFSDR